VPAPVAAEWGRSETVTVASGTTADGRRVWFISNWSSSPATAIAPRPVTPITGGDTVPAGTLFSLEPWASLVLVDE